MKMMTAASPESLLLDYAAGTATPAISLLLDTHLAMSAESRDLVAFMQSIGGILLDDLEGEPLDRISADSTLALVDADMEAKANAVQSAPDPRDYPEARTEGSAATPAAPSQRGPARFNPEALPKPLRRAETASGKNRQWQRLGYGVATAELAVLGDGDRAHLLWAKGGTGIASHRHVGREVVLVLEGAFWDDSVRYGPGDVAVHEDGSTHAPKIDAGEDCLCLAVTEAPVHFTGLAGPILNRFCRF